MINKNLEKLFESEDRYHDSEEWVNNCLKHCKTLNDYSSLKTKIKDTDLCEKERRIYLSRVEKKIDEFYEESH